MEKELAEDKNKIWFKSFTDKLVAAYFLYNLLSLIWLVKGGIPAAAFGREFVIFLLPVLFYFVGRLCGYHRQSMTLLRYFIIAVLIVGIAGIPLKFILSGSLPFDIAGRSEQWIAAVNNMYSTWLGNGLGANGQGALGIDGAHVIEDSGLVKMYCEQGIFGFSMFLYLMILTLKKGFSNLKECFVQTGFIAAVLLLSIGSNMLTFQPTASVFWFAVGLIDSKEYKEKMQ